MEILLPLGVVVFLIWLIAKVRRNAPKDQTPDPPTPDSLKSLPQTSVRRAVVPRRTVGESECWVPPGKGTTVCGYVIPGGMLYVGEGLPSVNGGTLEHSLINPALPVNRLNPDRSGTGMGYWPSYALIPAECRAGYLEWLASGRRDPDAYIGYVFLYFYGLERRALSEARHSEQAKAELPTIVAEVEQLLRVYNGNGSFRGYAGRFLEMVQVLSSAGVGEVTPPMERTGYELPIALRVEVGRIVAAGKPVPADWALSWFLTDPENALRTAVPKVSEGVR